MWLLLFAHLPGWIVGWLFVVMFYGWATSFRLRVRNIDGEPLVLTNEWRTWVVRPRGKKQQPIWRYTTTVGRGVIGQVGALDTLRIAQHEAVHIRQTVDRSVLGLLLGVLVLLFAGTNSWVLATLLWGTAWAWQLPNFLTAVLRNAQERPPFVGWFKHWIINTAYRTSEHERSAYAQSDLQQELGKSWLSIWRK